MDALGSDVLDRSPADGERSCASVTCSAMDFALRVTLAGLALSAPADTALGSATSRPDIRPTCMTYGRNDYEADVSRETCKPVVVLERVLPV